MQRFLIGGIAALALLGATFAISMGVSGALKEASRQDVEDHATRAAKQYEQLSRLAGIDAANLAAQYSGRGAMASIMAEVDATERRKLAFTQAESINNRLEKAGRKADVVAILGADGKVIARDLNAEAMFGDDLGSRFPAVKLALKGEAVKDIWNFSGRTTQVAIAPVRKDDNTVAGALMIGYVISFKGVRELRELLGVELGLFHEGKVQTSSFTTADGQENGNKTQALSQTLFAGTQLAAAALSSGKATPVSELTLDGETYAAVATPIPGNANDKLSGVVVLASLAGAGTLAAAATGKIWVLGIIGILAVLLAAVMTAKRFISPLDKIELGVADIINGNIDYQFQPTSRDFEGLSNSLNVMLSRLLGREEPNEEEVNEEEEAARWKAEQMQIDEGDGNPAGVNAAALSQENEAAYYPRLFNEYVAALRNTGVRSEGVAVQLFTAKLRLVEGGLKRKWNCRMVRFRLAQKDGQPLFQAVKIA